MGLFRRKTGSPGWLVFQAIGLASALLVLFAWWLRPGFLAAIELKATDAMFIARGSRSAPAEVVIVAVDEKSVNELGRWPWTRTTTAALFSALSEAKTIAVDMVFSEPQDQVSDKALASSIAAGGNVVLGYFFRGDALSFPDPSALSSLNSSKMTLVSLDGSSTGAAPWPSFHPLRRTSRPLAKGPRVLARSTPWLARTGYTGR